MGNFIALSSVIGKPANQVTESMARYAVSVSGGFEPDSVADEESDNHTIVIQAFGNTTVRYPSGYLEWDESSAFISKDLNTSVFSFHIHDGDLWMYTLYHNGEVVDQFNPIPDYWDDSLSPEELDSWKGNASIIEKYLPNVKADSISNYLVRWNDEDEEKAYPGDEYGKEEWQLHDFMEKLNLPYTLPDNSYVGVTFHTLWTSQLKKSQPRTKNEKTAKAAKQWWKFWSIIPISILLFSCFSFNAYSQDSTAIRRIDAMVKLINNADLNALKDSVKTDYLANEMSFRTYLTALVKNKELKKYINDIHSKRKENGVTLEMHAISAFYFNENKLIKVEEKVTADGKELLMDWYFENDKSVHYTSKSERSEERAEMLLKLAQGFLDKVKL
ncbi:hypothetical protein HHL16_21380 [Pseudoflavitalea sp. G-6-1-2]|uniref:hypothetical protein n=1 Tax=Pseudoflavitalea sp. G-6-1-2 TaxID=2728841 RepID=UPI00146B792C|nr:hypothetical protein [Pseudoflavitalea sp. G-6-1-2]NML23446.1 hypothetical protein [Pseudoflavitalea sp. G-6-1-2]